MPDALVVPKAGGLQPLCCCPAAARLPGCPVASLPAAVAAAAVAACARLSQPAAVSACPFLQPQPCLSRPPLPAFTLSASSAGRYSRPHSLAVQFSEDTGAPAAVGCAAGGPTPCPHHHVRVRYSSTCCFALRQQRWGIQVLPMPALPPHAPQAPHTPAHVLPAGPSLRRGWSSRGCCACRPASLEQTTTAPAWRCGASLAATTRCLRGAGWRCTPAPLACSPSIKSWYAARHAPGCGGNAVASRHALQW